MTGQSWPQSRSGRSSPSVRVAKNHSTDDQDDDPRMSEALPP